MKAATGGHNKEVRPGFGNNPQTMFLWLRRKIQCPSALGLAEPSKQPYTFQPRSRPLWSGWLIFSNPEPAGKPHSPHCGLCTEEKTRGRPLPVPLAGLMASYSMMPTTLSSVHREWARFWASPSRTEINVALIGRQASGPRDISRGAFGAAPATRM